MLRTTCLRYRSAVSAGLLLAASAITLAADLTSTYTWKPVRIGAGGLVTGMVIHPLDSNVRYIRTDVGSAYRWNATTNEWVPLNIRQGSNGLPAATAAHPAAAGIESIAIDPQNTNVVYMAYQATRSNDLPANERTIPGSVYKSTNRGDTFVASNLSITMDPNGNWRLYGERMAVDPRNSNIVYYGSRQQGLWRSTNGGLNWSQLTGGGAPATNSNVVGVRCYNTGSSTITYAMVGREFTYSGTPAGDVFRSTDGGNNWTNISAGTGISGSVQNSTLDSAGNLWVVKLNSKEAWRYNGSSWTGRNTDISANLWAIACDPNNVNRLWALGGGGGTRYSVDGGNTWVYTGDYTIFNQSFAAWLPQPPVPAYHQTTNLLFDNTGRLWMVQGNEGVLTYVPTYTENASNPPRWNIVTQGVEEIVTHQIIIPKGGGGRVHYAGHDVTGHTITNPDQFNAKWINLQALPSDKQYISNGTGIAHCPNVPTYVAVWSTDVNLTNGNYPLGRKMSGFSTNGGDSWQFFATQPPGQCGQIAVSFKNPSWPNHHLVVLPAPGPADGERGPHYSKDGGVTWTPSRSDNGFPINGAGFSTNGQTFITNFAQKQTVLMADPFVADKFYLKTSLNGFWVSTNGGESWTQLTPGDPASLTEPSIYTFHGQLQTNYNRQNDLWFADGWEGSLKFDFTGTGARRGLWRSTNGGSTWARIPAVETVYSVALGKGNGGANSFAVYIYGKLLNDPAYGVFRSTDEGVTWDRLSFYPTGLFDLVSCMGASWDEFGLVYVGFNGNTLVYGKPNSGTTPTPTPTPTATPTPSPTPPPASSTALFTGRRIALKAVNGRFVQSVNFTGDLIAQGTAVFNGSGSWEQFDVLPSGENGYVRLRAVSNGTNYVIANSNGTTPANAGSTNAGEFEKFAFVQQPNGKFTILAKSNNRYLQVLNGGSDPANARLVNNTTNQSTWESFDVLDYGATAAQAPVNVNLLQNSSFELGGGRQLPFYFNEDQNTAAAYTELYLFENTLYVGLTHWNPTAFFNAHTFQTRYGLPNGQYRAVAYVLADPNVNGLWLGATGYGGAEIWQQVPVVTGDWQVVEIPTINVTSGQCTISVWTEGAANEWSLWDDVELYRK